MHALSCARASAILRLTEICGTVSVSPQGYFASWIGLVFVAQTLGEGKPHLQSWARYYRRGQSTLYRDMLQARGLRVLVRAEGTGERLDALQIVTQLFVALALFPIAAMLADTIMQTVFSERRHYREYKTEESPDFSDVRAKVEQLDKQSRSRQAKAMNYV